MPVRSKSQNAPAKVPTKVSGRVAEVTEVVERPRTRPEPTAPPEHYIPVSHAYLVLIGISAIWLFLLVGVYGWLLRTHDLTRMDLIQEQITANGRKDDDEHGALTRAVLDLRSELAGRWTAASMAKFVAELERRNPKIDIPDPDDFGFNEERRPTYLDPAQIGTGALSPQSFNTYPY